MQAVEAIGKPAKFEFSHQKVLYFPGLIFSIEGVFYSLVRQL
jgi:hypothetical protein